jgi:hypothetical protein
VDWAGQVAPYAEFAAGAATGKGMACFTGNNLSEFDDRRPNEYKDSLSRTPFVLNRIFAYVASTTQQTAGRQDLVQRFLSAPMPDYTLKGMSGTAKREAEKLFARGGLNCTTGARTLGVPSVPAAVGNLGSYFSFTYCGTQAKDHIEQGSPTLVNILDIFLKTAWNIPPAFPGA